MTRRGLWIIVAVLGLVGCKRGSSAPGLPPATGSNVPVPEVPAVGDPTEAADSGAAQRDGALSGTGTLYPRAEAQLGPKMSGVLSAVKVEQGDKVKKGQLVFQLEGGNTALSVKQAKTLLQAARVSVRSAEIDHKRTKELYDRGSVAPATFDQVQARYDAAKAQLAQAEVTVSMAQKGNADTTVRSPIDGVVTAKLKSVGETVTMMPPTVVLVVQDVSELELRARLPERALARLQPGTLITVRLPAVGVERIVPVVRINPAVDVLTRTVEVVAKLDNNDRQLKPGMLADIDIGGATADAGLVSAGKKPR